MNYSKVKSNREISKNKCKYANGEFYEIKNCNLIIYITLSFYGGKVVLPYRPCFWNTYIILQL